MARDFFREEYILDHMLYRLDTPYVRCLYMSTSLSRASLAHLSCISLAPFRTLSHLSLSLLILRAPVAPLV